MSFSSSKFLEEKSETMSGGNITYSNLEVIIEEIEAIIDENQNDYSAETIIIHEDVIRMAAELKHKLKCIDLLEGGDYSEDTFLEKVREVDYIEL